MVSTLPSAQVWPRSNLVLIIPPPLPAGLPTRSVAKFAGVHSLDLLIPANFGADHTVVAFVGLRGEFTERRRQAVEAVYESKPMPQDHKVPGREAAGWNMGM